MKTEPATDVGADGQRHYLTLLFADLSDSSALGELMEAEDYASLLAELRVLCREVVGRYGGEIARIQGDGLLAFFGWPHVAEDDGRRATRAALELHSAVARLSQSIRLPDERALRLHSGIHAGLVLLSPGDMERGRFELLGNVPNIASHLSSLAAEDDIVVSEETLGPHRHSFLTSDRQMVRVGKRDVPLAVYRVLGRASRGSPKRASRPDLTPFVGRESELRALNENLRAAVAGSNVCAVVSAPAGMGKSRLIEELLQRAADEGVCTLRGFSEDYLGAVPLQPFLQTLRGWCDDVASATPIPPELTEKAQAFLSKGLDQQGDAALRALVDLLADLAARCPVLVVLDDWQWADEASQKVLEGLRALERPLMILLGTRLPAEQLLLSRPAEAIALEPLDAQSTARLLEALLPRADPFTVADIHRQAGGNPLYVEELCHAAQVDGSSWRSGVQGAGSAWLSGLIESRVARLPAPHGKVVRTAAVLGTVFPAWLLERVTGYPERHELIGDLATADLIFSGEQAGTLRFKHGITRDVIYGTVGLQQRQRLHLLVAEALSAEAAGEDSDQYVELLAYHCAAGKQFESASRYAERAGDKAMTASALDRARSQYISALRAMDELAPLPPEIEVRWCEVAQKLGMACVFDPLSLVEGIGLFERGLAFARHTERADLIARAEYWLGYIRYAKGQAIEARRHCEAALRIATESGDHRLSAQVRAVYGQVLLTASDYAAALPLLDAGLEARKPSRGKAQGIPVGAAYTLACKAYLLGDQGQFAQAEECFTDAFRLIGDSRHQVASSVRHWRCVVLQWQGRWDDALQMADDSASIAEYTRSRQQLLMGRAMAGYIRWVLSRRNEELQTLREATAWIEAREGRLGMSLNHSWMLEGALTSGREDEARYHAARLFARARQRDRLGEALGCRALALAASKLNHFGRAERYLDQAGKAATARSSAHERACNQLCAAQISLDKGLLAEGRALLEQAMQAFSSMSMVWHIQRARRLLLLAAP